MPDDKPLDTIQDDPQTVAELNPPAQPLDAEPAPERAEQPAEDWRDAIKAVAEQNKALTEAFNQFLQAQTRAAQEPRYAPPPPPTPAAEPRADWRAKVAPGTPEILQEAMEDFWGRKVKEELGPSLGYLHNRQATVYEKYLEQENPHPQFGYAALKDDVDAYIRQAAARGISVDPADAYEKVAFRIMRKATADAEAEIQRRARDAKRSEFVDTTAGRGRAGAEPEAGLTDEERAYARRSWPEKTPEEAEKLWQQHKAGAERDGLIEIEERKESRAARR